MIRAPIIMAAVAGVAGLGGVACLVGIRGSSDGAVYARRIATTMLFALAVILGFFALSMAHWGPSA